jgi:hypothetical protein
MANLKRLNRLRELLWQKNDDKIRYEQEWSYDTFGWTINFIEDNDESSVVAYRIKNDKTDWSDYIVLEKYVKEWRKIA